MKYTKWIISVFSLVVLTLVFFQFIKVLASPYSQTIDPSIYLPIIIKPEQPTPTPTTTNTPTPTQTQTPTNTPTKTTVPPSVQILPNHSYFVDDYGYLYIIGEVLNNTADNITSVKISVNIFNSSGHLLDTNYTFIYLDNLPAWDKTCFHFMLQEPSDWSYYEFEAPTYYTDGQPLPNLTVLNDSGSYDPTYDEYEIIGQVRNDNGDRVEYVQPVGTIYNASGTVVGCDFTYVNSTHLDPDQVSAFKLTFYDRDYADVTSYRLQVDGNPQP
jgi:hypothetical protein